MNTARVWLVVGALGIAGCGDTGDPSEQAGTGSSGGSEVTGPADTSATTTTTTGGDTGGSTSGVDSDASSGPATTGGEPTELPTPTGTCPTFESGDVTFSPAGTEPRDVRVWMGDAAATMDGPLIFYWHGTGSSPQEAVYGLGTGTVEEVTAQGGIVVAPYSDPASGQWPWYLTGGQEELDLLVADEVVACAIETVGIDVTRIHSIGMSAGGLHTAQMSFRRSSYLASVVLYSGGFIGGTPPDQDPSNPFSAMIFHGGADDVVVISFQDASENYLAALQSAGRYGFICDHGGGHVVPMAQQSVWQFFQDHPYGTVPSPYQNGLPAGFPDYCTP